ncbi:hypothetical protein AFLA_007757 [Aspergillus flavus NRRL3357]|nr:hypothetical protein AFLA_007757 [Aspergillus flavus NRRL3357]
MLVVSQDKGMYNLSYDKSNYVCALVWRFVDIDGPRNRGNLHNFSNRSSSQWSSFHSAAILVTSSILHRRSLKDSGWFPLVHHHSFHPLTEVFQASVGAW